MTQTPHPLAQIAQLADADGTFPFALLVDAATGLTRLTCKSPSIWVLLKSEDGSMRDRWKQDEGAQFVRLTDAQIAKGAAHNWETLHALAVRLTAPTPPHPLYAIYDYARSLGLDTIDIYDPPNHPYTGLVFSNPEVLVKYHGDPNSNIDRITFGYHKRLVVSDQDLSGSPATQLRALQKRIAELGGADA
ncbi:hypothetical protein [Roseobacter sp. N2S]|uniref:hypothetical protein n=1 Tax=Roseobacter sp. N2S TaxID=2663844 RepID=UPI002854666B|nr:hypothetical protein [Roseobacter sp. N2S]MDR6263832.1 hypothetical protein [Roseobacter sp. N2S]